MEAADCFETLLPILNYIVTAATPSRGHFNKAFQWLFAPASMKTAEKIIHWHSL
jgi:hypothetical protein